MLGWQPVLSVERTNALLVELRRVKDGELDECEDELELALVELETNLEVAERACYVNGRISIAEVAWLGRLTRVLAQAAHALEGEHEQPAVLAAAFDPVLIAPPLTIATLEEKREALPDVTEPADAAQSRLVELQLAAIDHVIEAARSEGAFLERRRRLMEAARRLLLDADAALELAPEGVRIRKRYLTQQIVHIDRLQARGLSTHSSLLHQARSALARGERGRLHAALVAMEGFATAAGDLRSASLATQGLSQLDAADVSRSEEALLRSMERSVADVMGEDAVAAVENGYARGRRALLDHDDLDPEIYALANAFITPGAEAATLSALLSVDGCFDVGAPLAPVRIQQRHTVARVVAHPTQELLLVRARSAEDIPASTIGDPRSVLLDLAAGRLLARKFVRYEEHITERTEMMGEVRVYLLDGSTSMLEDPARARMRDAILTAELATLMARFQRPERYTRVLMFYRFFTKRLWPLRRVGTATEALASIGEVLSAARHGGTDIERALVSSFDMIRDARKEDGELSRAQVVLITDGEATVRERVVREARERVGEIPIAVSVIALGQENPALRALVSRQRAQGERAFYHFIDDQTLAELANGDLGDARALHLLDEDEAPMSRVELEDAVGNVLEEAAELERGRHRVLLQPPAELATAFEELGLPASAMSEGQQALVEAAERDIRALERRYRRWFPAPEASDDTPPPQELEDAVVLVLSTVAEVVSELGIDELERKADAIDVLERLLPDARISPARYDATVREPSLAVAEALQMVHDVTAPVRRGS